MKKLLNILMAGVMFISLLGMSVYAIQFTDLPSDHWAYEYITTLVDAGVINGYDDGTYKPSGTIKRSEFLKLIVTSCIPNDINISEMPTEMQHWAAGYVAFAEQSDLIPENTITIENIDEPITRIEMVRIISNADIIIKGSEQQFEKRAIFKDIAKLNTESLMLLRHAVSRGFITGYEDGSFGPDRTMTRAEAATIIYRFTR